MRHERVIGLVLLAVVAASSGCSRLTFVKVNPNRGDYERTAQDVEVHESREAKQRTAARNRVAMAQSQLSRGELDAAEAEVRLALKQQPDSADAYTLLAVITERRGRSAEAGAHYQRAAELAPTNGGALNNYGAWLCANGRAAESLAGFDRALAAPGYQTPGSALANAGACAEQGGQPGRVEQYLRAAIGYDPENPVALGALARHEYRAGRYMDARAFSQRRLSAAPADASALVLASQIEEKIGDTAAAARYVRRLREEFPGGAPGNPGDNRQR